MPSKSEVRRVMVQKECSIMEAVEHLVLQEQACIKENILTGIYMNCDQEDPIVKAVLFLLGEL